MFSYYLRHYAITKANELEKKYISEGKTVSGLEEFLKPIMDYTVQI